MITSSLPKAENDRSKGEVVKAIIVRCRAAKAIFAHCVPCKGADEQDYVANKVVEDILWLGYTELILKGDNERSLQSLTERVLTVVRVRIQQVATPPGRSGTSSSTVVGTEDAALASGGRAVAGESTDPAGRPGYTGADEDATAGQGDAVEA